MTIKKIINVITQYLDKGEERFVIFPYGKWGKITKTILNEMFKIKELAIIDNYLAVSNPEIITIDKVSSIDGRTFTVLFSVENEQVRDDLLLQAHSIENAQICDIALAEEKKFMYFSMNYPKMCIDECSEEQRNIIFDMTKNAWEKLGNEEPFWSVVTHDEYKKNNMKETDLTRFYNSGKNQCISIINTLKRNEIIDFDEDVSKLEITEIGCGVGRITLNLAKYFSKVNAYDISFGNIKIAQRVVNEKNVEFCLVKSIDEYTHMPKADVVYSIIVLQHNCPAVIEYMLNAMFESVRENGVCIFQVPTYKMDYKFKYDEYIKDSKGKMEMHLLPQKKIFEIAYEQKCIPVEVYQDAWTNNDDFSTTFVFRKL